MAVLTCAASFFIAAFQRVTSPFSRLTAASQERTVFSDLRAGCSWVGEKLEVGPNTHLDLAWRVALRLDDSPRGWSLQAEAGVGEVQMIHRVLEDSGELQTVPLVGNEFFLDTEIKVEVRNTADPASSAGTRIEAQYQRTNVLEYGNGVSEHVDSGRSTPSVNSCANGNTVRIRAA